MYYIRKFSKPTSLYKIQYLTDKMQFEADFLKQELGTSGNTLSFWKFDDLNDNNNAVNAILLSTTAIKDSVFYIIDDELLEKYNIDIDCNEPGKTGYIGYENLHVNFCNLTYEKIGNMLEMINEAVHKPQYTYQLNKNEVIKIISEQDKNNLINYTKIDKYLKEDIEKYVKKAVEINI